jgi:ElaB/YqjD/DUF883 family membrane-anchored ribosome-binding protein
MERRAEDVRIEIEDVRDDLGEALEAIGDRVAPKKVMTRAKADLSDKVSPPALARRGAGALRRGLYSAVGSDETTRAPSPQTRSRALASQANAAVDSVAGNVGNAPRAARQRAQGNPIAAGLLALAGGFFVAALIPPSDREKELTERAKQRLEPLTADAVDAGKSMIGDLRSSAQDRLGSVQEVAGDAVQEVKSQAESSAGRVKGEATGATKTVKGQAKGAAGRVKSRAKASPSAVKAQTSKATR